ncbi:hypothetical protein E2C01_086752 [Portunus trituberculatus]|uniref:Uncharacterized protein n=1 Tax=Portunus trituberculatus TaxID=210409 RepID=A0A5B7JC97_PORTR|nr:hypothetical protein [Portunus trituberculatus]
MAVPQHQGLHLRNSLRLRDVLHELSNAELTKRYRLGMLCSAIIRGETHSPPDVVVVVKQG